MSNRKTKSQKKEEVAIVGNTLLPAVSLTLEQIEQELNSEIDYMMQCVQDSMGTIDPDKDIQDIETARRVMKSLFNGVEYRVRNGR